VDECKTLLTGLAHNFVQYEEKDVTGTAGLQKVGEWLDSGSLALDAGRGLLSSTFRLNVNAFSGTGDEFRGCLEGVVRRR